MHFSQIGIVLEQLFTISQITTFQRKDPNTHIITTNYEFDTQTNEIKLMSKDEETRHHNRAGTEL